MFSRLGNIFLFAVRVCVLARSTTVSASDQRENIQQIVDELRAGLAIEQPVAVSIVQCNPKLFSVVPDEHQPKTFVLSVEEGFAQGLNATELRAAVAHELGPVWIFTHFPFLQTEELANDIASRVVSRDSLAPLYDKVWKRRK